MTTLADISKPYPSTWNHIDALLDDGPGWNWLAPIRNTIFYSFSVSAGLDPLGQGITGIVSAFNSVQQNAIIEQLAYISQLTGIKFVSTPDGNAADLHFGNADILGTDTAGLTQWFTNYRYDQNKTITSYAVQAYVYVDNVEWKEYLAPKAGNYGYELLLHELGHVLGLKHPFSGNIVLPQAQDNTNNTLMSYNNIGLHTRYSPNDVAALNWIYGGDGLGGSLGVGAQGVYLMTTPSDDVITGTRGNDVLNGMEGLDAVKYDGMRAAYSVKKVGEQFTVSGANDGKDSVINIERVQFSDMTVNLTVQSNAQSISPQGLQKLEELYVAFFNRIPEADGLSYWISQFKAGLTIRQIAESFYDAGVQYSKYTGYTSSMTNSAFVNVIYRNVLGRPEGADPGGLTYWTNALESKAESRGSLVTTILNSAHDYKGDLQWGWVADLLENKIQVANIFAVNAGLNYNNAEESILHGMAIAAAITPTSITAAIALIGLAPDQLILS
jgi:serralysin